MRRALLVLGTLLLVLPPLVGLVLGLVPFDWQVMTSFSVLRFFPLPGVWMLLGGVLVLLGLRWRRG